MSKTTSIRLGSSTKRWIETEIHHNKQTFSSYIHDLVFADMRKTTEGKLYHKIDEVIGDIDERIDEVFVIMVDCSNSKRTECKEELDELNQFKIDLKEAQIDILNADITTEEAEGLLSDINNAQLN